MRLIHQYKHALQRHWTLLHYTILNTKISWQVHQINLCLCGLLLGLTRSIGHLGELMSELMDGPESLEALLRAERRHVQRLLGRLAVGADELATGLITLGIGTLDILGINGVLGDFRHG